MQSATRNTIQRLVGICLAVLMLSGPAMAAQDDFDPFEPSIGGMIWDELGNAVDARNEMNANIGAYNQDMARARARFWQLFPDKPGFSEAEAEFSRNLAGKDWWYLMIAMPEGVGGNTDRLMRTMAMAPDDGINPVAEFAFKNWVNRLRYRLGAQSSGQQIIVNPLRLMEAIQQEQASSQTYQLARNIAEFRDAGRDIQVYLNKYRNPRTYAHWLLELRLAFNRSGWAPGIEWPNRTRRPTTFTTSLPGPSARRTWSPPPKPSLMRQRTPSGTWRPR